MKIDLELLRWFKPDEIEKGQRYADSLRHPDYTVEKSTNADGHFHVSRRKKNLMKDRSTIIREIVFAFLLKSKTPRTSTFLWASTQGTITQQTGRNPSRREVQEQVDKLLEVGSAKIENGGVVLTDLPF
jgi:hypothetical protein